MERSRRSSAREQNFRPALYTQWPGRASFFSLGFLFFVFLLQPEQLVSWPHCHSKALDTEGYARTMISGSSSDSDLSQNDTFSKKKNAVRVKIEYNRTHEKVKSELMEKLHSHVPEAKVSAEPAADDCFEVQMNHKVVFSRRLLKHNPNVDEMVEIAYWLNKGKNFMHLYLCTFVEGGEPNMAIADRKATPFMKRAILSCTIS